MFYGNGVAIQIFPFSLQFSIFSKIVSLEDIRFKLLHIFKTNLLPFVSLICI